jgi:hypothetical protein
MLASCAVLSVKGMAQPQQSQITVGPNVQVSKDRPDMVHDEVLLAADPSNPNRLIGCSLAIPAYGVSIPSEGGGIRHLSGLVYMSDDAGKTWRLATEFASGATTAGMDNHCAFGSDGTAFFITGVLDLAKEEHPDADDLDHKPGSYEYFLSRRSTDGGHTWSDWYKIPHGTGVDRQYIIADDTNSKYHGRVYITGQIEVYSIDNESQGLAFSLWRSLDNGATFERPLARYGNAIKQTVFNPWNPVVLSDGTLAMLFVDGSQMPPKQPTPIKIVFSRDGGESMSKSYKVADAKDTAIPPICLAVDRSDGPFKDRLYVTWADKHDFRSEIYIVHSSDKGKTWSTPQVVNDDRARPGLEEGPTDITPVVAVNKQGVVGLMWYDRRDNPKDEGYWVRFSASMDGGETWYPSLRISERPNNYLRGERTTISAARDKVDDTKKVSADEAATHINVIREEWVAGGHTSGLVADGNGKFHGFWVDNRTGIHQVWSSAIEVPDTAAKNGGGDLAALEDVSDKVVLDLVTSNYNDKTQTMTLTARLKNLSKDTVHGPMKVRAITLGSDFALVKATNADNRMTGTGAVWDFSPLLNNSELKSEESSQTRTLTFQLLDPWSFDVTLKRKDGDMRWSTSLLTFDVKVLAKPEPAQKDPAQK